MQLKKPSIKVNNNIGNRHKTIKHFLKSIVFDHNFLWTPSEKKLDILSHRANFNCHLPTLPNYDLQVIMTNIKIKLGSNGFIFNEKTKK